MSRPDPYRVLHWGALGGVIGFGGWLIVLIACWTAPWSGIPQITAAALGIAGCVVGLTWLKERELNMRLFTQWQQQQQPEGKPAAEDWEAGS